MKNQEHLTESQRREEIKKRHNVQKVGFEIEVYSELNVAKTGQHINQRMGLDNLEAIKDESVYDYEEEVKDGEPTNPKRDLLNATPVRFAFDHNSNDFDYLVNTYGELIPEALAQYKAREIDENQLFDAMENSRVVLDTIINQYSNDLSQYDRYETRRVHRTGVEIRLESPVSHGKAYDALKDLETICKDPVINAKFHNPENGNGRTDNPEMTGENHGLVGLHVHFGLSPQVEHSSLDLLRLLLICQANEDRIEELAGRPHNRWAKKLSPIINDVDKAIRRLVRGNKITSIDTQWFNANNGGFSLNDPRYYGVNVTNIGMGTHRRGQYKKLNTIEFRWGASEICADVEKSTKYFNLLTYLVDSSFTGEKEMKWGNFTLRDISDSSKTNVHKGKALRNTSVIAVIDKNGKLIGRMGFGNLCPTFKTKLPSKYMEIAGKKRHDILSGDFTPRFSSIFQRELAEIIKGDKTEQQIRREALKIAIDGDKGSDVYKKSTRRILAEFRKSSRKSQDEVSMEMYQQLKKQIMVAKSEKETKKSELKDHNTPIDKMQQLLNERGFVLPVLDKTLILKDIPSSIINSHIANKESGDMRLKAKKESSRPW